MIALRARGITLRSFKDGAGCDRGHGEVSTRRQQAIPAGALAQVRPASSSCALKRCLSLGLWRGGGGSQSRPSASVVSAVPLTAHTVVAVAPLPAHARRCRPTKERTRDWADHSHARGVLTKDPRRHSDPPLTGSRPGTAAGSNSDCARSPSAASSAARRRSASADDAGLCAGGCAAALPPRNPPSGDGAPPAAPRPPVAGKGSGGRGGGARGGVCSAARLWPRYADAGAAARNFPRNRGACGSGGEGGVDGDGAGASSEGPGAGGGALPEALRS